MRCFQAYVAGIFLYNSEVWTLTEQLNHKIDVFQRKLLRRILNIKWTRKKSNIKLYQNKAMECYHLEKPPQFPRTLARKSISEFLRPV